MGLSRHPLEESMKQRSLLRLLAVGAAFMTTTVVSAPSITVTEQRLMDQRIQGDVMRVLAANTALTGKVVVESSEQVVTLSGHLATAGQVRIAGRAASGVPGVRHVVNDIRTRVGAVSNN